jgi:hypothetical protein
MFEISPGNIGSIRKVDPKTKKRKILEHLVPLPQQRSERIQYFKHHRKVKRHKKGSR